MAPADVTHVDEDDPFRENSAEVAERAQRFLVIRELLTAVTLGTSLAIPTVGLPAAVKAMT